MMSPTLSVDGELSMGCSCNQIAMGETAGVGVKNMVSGARHPASNPGLPLLTFMITGPQPSYPTAPCFSHSAKWGE